MMNGSNSKLGFSVHPQFRISQDSQDKYLLEKITHVPNCEAVFSHQTGMSDLNVSDLNNLQFKIIPFFSQYSLRGCKHLDFMDFSEIINIISRKEHLTLEGLNRIKSITSNMNSYRV